MKKNQLGVGLSGMLVWAVVIVVLAISGLRVVPTVIEYFKILKDSKAAVNQVGPEATVADVRKAFSRYAEIDQIELTAEELQITKEGGQIVISFAYERRIRLAPHVSLLIDYQGSSNASGKE